MVKKSEREAKQGRSDPETEQKKRLRSLALSKKLLRRAPADPSSPLEPSKSVLKLDGRDVVKKGQRKSRYLFSFPGLLAPLSGGRIGELAELSSKNPVLYLEFPQGRMKLFGTHVYPKNKYLTLQLTKSSKGVMCEDSFDSLIVFSEAWWIGTKEENPEERQLEFPKNLNETEHVDCDFKGGAGATFEEASGSNKPIKNVREPLSPGTDPEEDTPEDSYPSTGKNVKNLSESTPVRHSARMAGKNLSYAETSSGNGSISSDTEELETIEEQLHVKSDDAPRRSMCEKTEGSTLTTAAPASQPVEIKKVEQSLSLNISKETPSNKKGTLVQATLSTLFEKAAEKNSKRSAKKSPGPKASGGKRHRVDSKQITDQAQVKVPDKKAAQSRGRKSGTRPVSVRKQSQVQGDETEEISSDSQDDSDEDWAV